jgi:hypothetical protein
MREFTKDDAMRLISKMRKNYGKKFADQWVGVEVDELAEEMVEQYKGLTPEDFQRGITRMRREEWPPTIPAFRAWCEPESEDWLGAHEAWAIAEKSIGFDGQELTVIWTEQTAQAFSRCEDLVKTGDKYQRAEAKKIFCDAYDRLVIQAKDQGLKPVYVTSLGVDKDQAIAAIKQAEAEGFLPAPIAKAQLEHKQTTQDIQSDAVRYKTVAQEALAKIKDLIKPNVNKMTEEVKETQPWEVIEMQHIDPFDDFDAYQSQLKAEGKKLPHAVRFLAKEDSRVGGAA